MHDPGTRPGTARAARKHAGYFHRERETGVWSLRLEPGACARRYLFGWAALDILSVVPFDLILLTAPSWGPAGNTSLTRLPRCLKLLRLPRLFRCGARPLPAACAAAERPCVASHLSSDRPSDRSGCARQVQGAHAQPTTSVEGAAPVRRYLRKWKELLPISSIVMQVRAAL